MYVQLVYYSGQWQNTASYSRTTDTALKYHKYNFACKLPQTIPSVKSKFTALCKNITTLNFRLCHTYCFGSSLSFFLS
jgi:Cdc6-like AAA superfamily ATPase